MECDQCGARRPRSGPCPECGAPPPGTYSSMRQWRDQSRSGQGPAVGRGSGANWGGNGGNGGNSGNGGNASSNRMRNPGNQRNSGTNWDEGGYDEAPPMRSNARNRRSAPGYEEMDLEQALVPAQNNMLPMDPGAMSMGAGLPALPGLPQTDEEERAIGIRRPVYIPATGEKRKRKLGTWRVVSGVLSVMLICIASCGAAAVFGHNQIAGLLQKPLSIYKTVQPYSTENVPLTPVATAGPQGKYVTGCVTAEGHDINGVALKPTSHFYVNHQTWMLCLASNFSKGSHVFSIHWFLDGVNVAVPTQNSTVTTDKAQILEFSYVFGQPGLGTAQVFMDLPSSDPGTQANDPYLAATIYFAIDPIGASTVPPNTPTVTPSPSPKATGTPKK